MVYFVNSTFQALLRVSVTRTATNPDGCSDQNPATNQFDGVPPQGAASKGSHIRKSELAAGKTLASWGLALLSCPAAKSGAKAACTWCYCCTACSQPVAVAAARPWARPFKFI